jgi:hypothetical protein
MRITGDEVDILTKEGQSDLLKDILHGIREHAELNGARDILEVFLYTLDDLDNDDFFGTEGWRHRFGLDH